jgi:DNA-binding HxlR family transcriptional regulator
MSEPEPQQEPEDEMAAFCPRFQRGVEVIGRRWTGAVVRALMGGTRRFNQIADTVPGISDRLLSERLKELEAEDIVERRVVPSTPVRVDYRLTAKGRELVPVFEALGAWAERWVALPGGTEEAGTGKVVPA